MTTVVGIVASFLYDDVIPEAAALDELAELEPESGLGPDQADAVVLGESVGGPGGLRVGERVQVLAVARRARRDVRGVQRVRVPLRVAHVLNTQHGPHPPCRTLRSQFFFGWFLEQQLA